jgi:hypothetical protein
MTDFKDQYVETTDLYLEMLWQAQRVEDRKLVGLLHQRLLRLTVSSPCKPVVCRIIPFPAQPGKTPCLDTASGFWPANPATNTLAYLASYCLLIFTGWLANLA